MATISSAGIGSGLDVNSIVTQLVALEKQPLALLATKATTVQSKVSALGTIQAQFAALTDVAVKISTPAAWGARTTASSNTSIATITATATANAGTLSLDVDQLALSQSVSSAGIATGGLVGAGTLTLRLGSWSGTAASSAADAAAAAAEGPASAALALDGAAASALTTFATGTPSATAYASAYAAWVTSVGANDHASPALQADEANALAALNTERGNLLIADPAALMAADALTANADATDASALKGAFVTATTAANAVRASFVAASGSADVAIDVTETDTVATLATKINAVNAGVVATSFNDGTQDRLLLRSKDTGAITGFKLTANDTVANGGGALTGTTGLARVAYDPGTGAFGMAGVGLPVQMGQDAKARINGLAVTSASNTLSGNIPGVSIKLSNVTTTGYGSGSEVRAPLTLSISEDVTPAVKNVNDFVNAYNTLIKSLSDLTKYDSATNKAGLFQGDSSVVNIQNMLRSMVGSSSLGATSQRLADIGIERKLDGTLNVNVAKLSTAANDGTTLQQLFTNNNNDVQTNGFALKFRDLGRGIAASGGAIFNKAASLQTLLANNTKEQEKINTRAALFETRLRKQYTTLDTQMAQLTSLNTFVTQQIGTWNKSSS